MAGQVHQGAKCLRASWVPVLMMFPLSGMHWTWQRAQRADLRNCFTTSERMPGLLHLRLQGREGTQAAQAL